MAMRPTLSGLSDLRRLVLLCLAVVLASAVASTASFAQEEKDRLIAFDARIAGDELRTRVVIDFLGEPDFDVHYLDDPARVVVDLPETVFGFPDESLEARGLFERIRYGAMGPGRSRIVMTAPGPVELDIAKVEEREDGRGYRMVFDAIAIGGTRFAELVSKQRWPAASATGDRVAEGEARNGARPFTVVIDPGHGGIDSGARGRNGTLEKNVTLAFGKAIAAALAEKSDARVVLTRTDDRFVSLSGRVRIAREHEADLMLSVHADSIRLPEIRGATVYTLSDKASDAMAADLARQENSADEVAGVSVDVNEEDVVDILMDLARRETKVFSIGLARAVLDGIRGDVRLINNPHRYAGFRVLRAPDVPSLLLELGYLSNTEDEKLLNDPQWRESMADMLANAILGFRAKVFASAGDL